MQRLINRLAPFIVAGVAIVILTFGIMILAYLFLFGAVIGMILFMVNWLRSKMAAPKSLTKPKNKSGRIIDSDDWRVL